MLPGPHSHDASETGLLSSLGSLFSSAAGYLKVRKDLFLLEARTAGGHFGLIVGLFVAALILILFGYLFLTVTLVFALATLFDDSHAWIWALGIAGLLHVLGALAAVLVAKSRLKTGVFETSIEELKKDSAWLTNLPKKS